MDDFFPKRGDVYTIKWPPLDPDMLCYWYGPPEQELVTIEVLSNGLICGIGPTVKIVDENHPEFGKKQRLKCRSQIRPVVNDE